MSGTWRAWSVVATLAVALGVMGVGPALAAGSKSPDPGDKHGAKVVKAGWWWAANESPPETGLLAAPQPASNVPKGSIPVGAVAGDPEKVAAVEFRLKAEPGAIVTRFTMVLREAEDPGANANVEAAKILACPVTEVFWADGQAAAWQNRPEYDCDLAQAPGKRNKSGLWRFDLTALATPWLAEDFVGSHSVVLVEDVEAPESFEVTFDGVKAKGVGLELDVLPPLAETDDPGSSAPPVSTPDTGSSGAGGSSLGGGGGSAGLGSGGGGSSLGGGSAPAPVDDAGPAADQSVAADAGQAQDVAQSPVAATPAWHSGLPRATFLLVPLALALAYLIMIALGQEARPATVTARHGVSRALDRLRQTGVSLTTRSAR